MDIFESAEVAICNSYLDKDYDEIVSEPNEELVSEQYSNFEFEW